MTERTVDRRSLLAALGGGATLAAAPLAEAQVRPAGKGVAMPAIRNGLPDIAVIGAGAFGGWTALVLRERGYNVTLIDAYGPGNPHGSSGGESRNIRASYGERDLSLRLSLLQFYLRAVANAMLDHKMHGT